MVLTGVNPSQRSLRDVVPLLLLPALLVLASVAQALYACRAGEPPPQLRVLEQACFVMLIWAWFRGYSRRYGIKWPMDMGLHLALAWWALLPYYVVKAQGWRGLGVIASFGGMYLAAWVAGTAIATACSGE